MQAVILAAGKSTRTYPLTLTRPKPLLPVANKPVIFHTLERLEGLADEVIIVTGYKGRMIRDVVGSSYGDIRIRYVEQEEQQGTAHALLQARQYLQGRFLLLMGDDLYPREGMQECLKHQYSLLTTTVEDPEQFGVVKMEDSKLVDIIEKPKDFISDRISTALYVLDTEIFALLEKLDKTERGEIEMPDAIRELAKHHDIICVHTDAYHAISFPWKLLEADKALRRGENIIGKNTEMTDAVTDSSIGDNCLIEGIVKGSIIMENTHIAKGSIIEDSILGAGIEFSGTIETSVHTMSQVKGKRLSAGRFGAALGDGVQVKGAHLKPGVKIWPGKHINGDITEDQR